MTPEQKEAALQLAASLCCEFEGFRAEPYRCPAGVWTIGYGSTRYPDGRKVQPTDPSITELQARDLMLHTLRGFMAEVLGHCPDIASTELLAACTDLAYNIGANAFGGSTLRRVINAGGSTDDIAAQFRRWTRSGGKVLPGLVRRREAEISLFADPS